MNYKNSITGEIISAECYRKLPESKKHNYHQVYDEPTHKYEESNSDDGFSLSSLIGLSSGFDSGSSGGSLGSAGGDFGGFSGGSGGGGGASGDF